MSPNARSTVEAKDRRRVLAALKAVLPPAALLSDEEDIRPYECDALAAHCALPLAVCLPEDERQVRDVLRVCRLLGVPVVSRGAGTGLSGGAMPHPDGVVLSLARLNRILRVDPESRIAVVQAGATNASISQAAAPHGLFFAPDPSSQVVCSIGGNVAENAGGVHCVKYGLTVHHVLRVRALNSEGEVLDIGMEAPDAPGYDLLALINGSEGTLAVVTEVTVRLLPKPEIARVALASFSNISAAGAAVSAIFAAGIVPAGLELMDKATIAAVSRYIDAGYDSQAAAVLLCELDGTAQEVDEGIEAVRQCLTDSGALQVRVSTTAAEREELWAGRKAAFPAVSSIKPDYYCLDGSIPRRRLGEMLAAIEDMERAYRLSCINVFHAGDGNLHPLILFDSRAPGEWQRAMAFGGDILEKTVAFGGAITGEHGVGIEKLKYMTAQFSPRELETLREIRAAFDEAGVLNPGKAIPLAEIG